MVSALDSISRGFETWLGLFVVFLGKTLHSHSASESALNLEPRSVVCSAPFW